MNKIHTTLLACLLSVTAAFADGADSSLKPPGSGSSLRFDGADDRLLIDGKDAISGTFTVEMWVKPDEASGPRGIIGSRNPNEYGFDLKLDGGRQIHANIGNGSGWVSTAADALFNCTPGSWSHIAYVVTPTNNTIYANGKKIGSGTYNFSTPLLRDASHQLNLGWSGFGNEFFKGEIGETRIWNIALTPRRIAKIWNQSVTAPQAGLVACYRFDEGGGIVAHDVSGHGNDGVLLNGTTWTQGRSPMPLAPLPGSLTFREIRYDGRLADNEARFTLDIDAEAVARASRPSGSESSIETNGRDARATIGGEFVAQLLEGDVAILPGKLPDALKIVREGNRYLLVASRPGQFKFKLEVVAKIQRAEPWNQISFTGPLATIASVTAQAGGAGMEVQLLNGTLLESTRTNGVSCVKGFLGADQTVALRWQGKITEVARKALLTVDSTITAQVTPGVVKYTSQFRYEIVQGNAAQLTLSLPATQALTRLVGEQIRDWHTTTDGDRQTLTIEFIKPVEKNYALTLYSEQPVEGAGANASLNPPQPLEVERESGALTVSAEDTLVEIASLAGLRQVNAPDQAIAAYRFNARPFTVALKLRRIEPVISVADRVNARLEETRLVISHSLTVNVEKAGVYALELLPPAGFAVAEVRGDGVEDWKISDGKLRMNFSARVLGPRKLDVQLEQPLKTFPDKISVAALRVTGAVKETAQIGAASAAGIRLKTAELSGLREIPVNGLANRGDEILAYNAEQPDWKLAIACERLAARVVADVFNLVTIGDGIVGGSATIRYGLVNQGVQEFKVKLPAHCRNVEFTGPNIRRKELFGGTSYTSPTNTSATDNLGTRVARPSETDTNFVVWTIGLQDKAWGGYTLVVTYDYQFDPKGATLPIGGVHTVDVERETGSVAVTTAASLQLNAKTVSDTLRRVDEMELSAADRSFITRAVILAYQYTGEDYAMTVDVKRYAEERVLEAVADRTQITSVLTEAGEMLTQASFMVKNNEKQFQRFQLPKDSKLWGCYVNGQPAKPERDGDWILVSLPRDLNRDQAFAVDITYAQTNGALASAWSKNLELAAPRTDVPNTYAEWQIFVPPTLRLSSFGGSMNIAQGTTYELLDAWEKFLAFYLQVLREMGAAILVFGLLAFLVVAFVISAVRRGWSGLLNVLVVVAILAILGAMLLPALSKAKGRAQRISSINNLKQIGLAARIWSGDNGDRLPVSFDEMKNELGTDKITYDVATGQRFTYIGAGLSMNDITPDSVIAYGPVAGGGCNVLMADGSVQSMSARAFSELNQRGLIRRTTPQQVAVAQREAVRRGQFANAPATPSAAPSDSGAAHNAWSGTAGDLPGAEGRLAVNALNYNLNVAGVSGIAEAPAPTVAGIRSLHIELPQTGQPFLFTKVLNVRDEPLSIRARVMPFRIFQNIQMAWQSAAFLLGLVVWWWQWRGANRSSFILTLALALMLGSVGSLLVQWRALHDALIIGFPIVTLAIVALLIWKYWPRRKVEPMEPPTSDSNFPPVIAVVMLLLGLSLTSATAADSRFTDHVSLASIQSASYAGSVNDRVALLEATLQFSAAKVGQTIPLFSDEVAVQQFTVKSGQAQLVRDGNRIAVRLGKGGDVTVQIKLLVKVAGDVTKRRLDFEIPPALTTQVAFTLDQAEADVDFPAAISLKRILDKDKTRVEAVMGSGDHVELLWTPRVKRAAEVAATVFCQNAAIVTFGGGVVNVRATLDYQVTQGELRQARVQLPAGQRLLRVEGLGIRTWEIKPGSAPDSLSPRGTSGERVGERGHASSPRPSPPLEEEREKAQASEGQILVVDLLKGVSPAWRLAVETERVLDALPVSVAVELPHALDVKRETGLVGLRGAEELGLTVESMSDLQRVDAEEFARVGVDKAGGLVSAFRFSKPDFTLHARAEAVQPQIEAVVKNYFRLGAEQSALSATIDFTIKRAGVFSLKVALPDGYRLERVTGNNILQYAEQADAKSDDKTLLHMQQSFVHVTLKDRTSGAYRLNLELARSFKGLPKSLAIAGVHPLGTVKLTGFIAVSAEAGVAVKTETFDGLTEIPAVSLPDFAGASGGSVLAYKFISSEPKSAPDWKLNVATETVESWVRAEIVNTLKLTETLVSGRSLVRYDIANSPVKELRIKVPESFRNVEITGANIRSREQLSGGTIFGGTSYTSPASSPTAGTNLGIHLGTRITLPSDPGYIVWRAELQSATRGFYTLNVTWEQARTAKTNILEVVGVSADGVERETGLLVLSAKAPLQVSELRATDLQRVDTGDVPDWAGRPDEATTLVYRYLRPGYSPLALEARRFDEMEVLQVLVDNARLTTVVADDGQMMTEMSLAVRNNGRQFLEVELPVGATVWSAFVAGQPVRPSKRDGKLLLPIQQSGADDGTLTVELTYVGAGAFPKARGAVGFESPKFDVPLKNARWEIYLPPDYDYQDFTGTMTRELAAAQTSSSSFSILDYSRMESVSKKSAQAEVRKDVLEAKRQLAGGNVREANATLSRAKEKSVKGRDEDAEVKRLESDLKSAQASNLISAQNDFSIRNNGLFLESGKVPAQLDQTVSLYANAAAEQQWDKLQQAQEIVAAKVQPLRVNLPVRGTCLAFTQVLQTESAKPMTIQLLAASTKTVSWPQRGALALGAFAILWGMVAVFTRATQRREA